MDDDDRFIDGMIDTGNMLLKKADELRDLIERGPEYVRSFQVSGELLVYTGQELRRARDEGLSFPPPDVDHCRTVQFISSLSIPSMGQLADVATLASGTTNAATAVVVELSSKNSNLDLMGNPPESWKTHTEAESVGSSLDRLNPDWGRLWRATWENILIAGINQIKSAATNARTIVDELSWTVPLDLLMTLPWCKVDNNGKPTRASRFAYMLHGDKLPASLNGDPTQDLIWRNFGNAYKGLQKYVHIASISKAEVTDVKSLLVTVAQGLKAYLNAWLSRSHP